MGAIVGHSNGGEMAARAVSDGMAVEKVVLLSTPVQQALERSIQRV